MNDNKYIEHFNTCFDILMSNKRTEYIYENEDYIPPAPVVNEKRSIFSFFKKKHVAMLVDENDEENKPYRSSKDDLITQFDAEIDNFMKEEFEPHPKGTNPDKNIVRSFEQMWYFAQFVRYAEKTIFYENIPTHSFYVDSALDEDAERTFCITKRDVTIVFKLKWIYDTTQKETLKAINIKVTRDFGKKMINEYTIVNGNVNLKDDSDYTLIAVINDLLYEYTLNTYKCIMNDLLELFEGRMTFPCRA